jgi:hypothetical protein
LVKGLAIGEGCHPQQRNRQRNNNDEYNVHGLPTPKTREIAGERAVCNQRVRATRATRIFFILGMDGL